MSKSNLSKASGPGYKRDNLVKQTEKRFRLLSRTLFLDVLFNRQTRPIFIYAVIIIGLGATLYHWLEGWSWLDSFYFVVITLTTIGYGDLHPTTSATKIITIFYGLNGIVLILMLFDVIRKLRGWDISDAPKNVEDHNHK
jgi:hypothetical protein